MRKFKLLKTLTGIFIILLVIAYFIFPQKAAVVKHRIYDYRNIHKTDNKNPHKTIVTLINTVAKVPKKIHKCKNIAVSYYYISKGDREYAKGNLIGAINYYHVALKLYPAHSKANFNLANILATYEDYAGSLEYYENAVKYNPKFLNARIALGILLSEKFFEYDRAIKEYKFAIDNAPKISRLPVTIIYDNKDFVLFNKSVAYYNMGLAYKWKSLVYGQTLNEVEESLENACDAYENAIKWDKKSYKSYFNLALTYQLLSRTEQAKHYYCEYIQACPEDYNAHYNLAILLRDEKNYFDAMLELEKAALIIDNDESTYLSRYI